MTSSSPSGQRIVVCGPPGCGKTSWVRARARQWDLVWDADAVASAIAYNGVEVPRSRRGPNMPFAASQALKAMREALLVWLERTPLYSADVYVIVSDPTSAAAISQRLGASLVDLGAADEPTEPSSRAVLADFSTGDAYVCA